MSKKTSSRRKHKNKMKIRLVAIVAVIILIFIYRDSIFSPVQVKDADDVETLPVISNEENTNVQKSAFENVSYYDIQNEQRYIDYKDKNPKLSTEDIVWMVNTNLDKEFYTDIKEIEDIDDPLFLVNKYNKLPDDYKPKNLEKLTLGQYLVHDAKVAFEEMQKDAKDEGYKINPVSGYRSIDTQRQLYNNYVKTDSVEEADTYSARAGHSEHNTGQALDICGSTGGMLGFGQAKESKWVEDNAYKYGFIIRYPEGYEDITGYKYEPWHLRYLGVEVATDMKEKQVHTYEEYYEKYIKNSL
jgi:D-alanyl-D-alanine carboxypeptidase